MHLHINVNKNNPQRTIFFFIFFVHEVAALSNRVLNCIAATAPVGTAIFLDLFPEPASPRGQRPEVRGRMKGNLVH